MLNESRAENQHVEASLGMGLRVGAGGTAGAAEVEILKTSLNRLPQELIKKLSDFPIRFVAVRNNIIDYFPELKGVSVPGAPGLTWELSPGGYISTSGEVVIAIRLDPVSGKFMIPRTGDGHGSYDLLFHELGHACDENRVFGWTCLENQDFVDAWKVCRKRFNLWGYGWEEYANQPDFAGEAEAFAESFARYFAKDPAFGKDFPELLQFWDKVVQEHSGPF
ncbi:MAG: hypothetical protein AB1403_12845 [Candidatus Riflebacteria bacterium]